MIKSSYLIYFVDCSYSGSGLNHCVFHQLKEDRHKKCWFANEDKITIHCQLAACFHKARITWFFQSFLLFYQIEVLSLATVNRQYMPLYLSFDQKVPGWIFGFSENQIVMRTSIEHKLTQLSILPGYKINKYQRLLGANLRWLIVPSRGSQRLSSNTTETGDKPRFCGPLGS